MREEALLEIFGRVDVDGSQIVAVCTQENENAWLLGLHAMRKDVRLVAAKGFEPLTPTPRIVLPDWITVALVESA